MGNTAQCSCCSSQSRQNTKSGHSNPVSGEAEYISDQDVPEAIGASCMLHDAFFSYKQSEAQDAVQTIILLLRSKRPSLNIWVDTEQDPTLCGMERGVRRSKVFIWYCTKNIVQSKYCLEELRWAVQNKKEILLVSETDPRHGAPELGVLRDQMPDELKHVLDDNVALPYYRETDHREVFIQKLLNLIEREHTPSGPRESDAPKRKQPVMVATSSSGFKDSAQAAENAFWKLVRELKGCHPNFIICHATCNYDLEQVDTTLRTLLSSSQAYVGCTSSAGVLINQTWLSHSGKGFGLFGIHDPDGCYVVAHAKTESSIGEVCTAALKRAGQSSYPELAVTFPAPGTEERVLEALAKCCGAELAVIGGSSADNDVSGMWKQMSSVSGVTSEGCAFALCWPSVLVHTGFGCVYAPTCHTGTITEMNGDRRIVTIDGEPAALVYNRWNGGAFQQQLEDKADCNILAPSTFMPLGVPCGYDLDGDPTFIVAHPHLIKTDDKSLITFKNLNIGEELTALVSTPGKLVAQISKAADAVVMSAPFDKEDILGSYQILCGGVMMAIKEDMPVVVEKLGISLGFKPTMGGCTFGEQASFKDGRPGHGNLMFTALLFSRIKKVSTLRTFSNPMSY